MQQIARVRGPAVAREVGGRGRSHRVLPARADRDGDHVLLEALLVADAGVAAGSEDVDQVLLGGDLEPDVREGGQEAGHDARQHQARGADGHVQSQRAGRAVAKAVDDVECRLDLVERRPQTLQQAGAGLGQRDAARGAGEQAHGEPALESAHGLAERGRAAAGGAGGVAEAPRAHDGHQRLQVGQVGRHCSVFGTTRVDWAILSRSNRAGTLTAIPLQSKDAA